MNLAFLWLIIADTGHDF